MGLGVQGSGLRFAALGMRLRGLAWLTVLGLAVSGVSDILKLGGAFTAFFKILVNKILFNPIRENIKCPKALPSEGLQRVEIKLQGLQLAV